ncbi:cyclase family protein [Botrimarina hoheduenensis]|uniref:Kynurenine formamidase n=1 Tax=Botrimarina hoheduenensis TaxID=2528000 RepID=A0A5C5VZC4_9BACT|nr:cyclase family protein [Botrimarina hoheduenensis]TWT43111.1 Kynurenine formamidase [Botrimarina hoheduenensis]
MTPLRGLTIGAGYFARFHFDAWRRMDDVRIEAVCDRDESRARRAAEAVGAASWFTDAAEALDAVRPDFVDLITPPPGKLELVERCAAWGVAILCQKPLADDRAGAERVVAAAHGVPFMVHENFRFQPWRRETKRLIDTGTVGDVHTLMVHTRMGDGWGEDAYVARQPYFRTMPRLLVHETGVHFLDTFRYLAGEIESVSAILRRLNPAIAGEDAALVTVRFASGAVAVWDANRYNETTDENPRLTFGDTLVEGTGGTIRLDGAGRLFVKRLGEPEVEHAYEWRDEGFAGDCVYATQRHFVERLRAGERFETSGEDYLRSLAAVEAAYESDRTGRSVRPEEPRRIVDLSRGIDADLPGAKVDPAKRLAVDGWNATTLTLYSHCGTHIDAPCHFFPGAATLDQQDLSVCCGPARIIDLTPVEPAELISVERFAAAAGEVVAGERLLLQTDWHRRHGEDAYRNALPRLSLELAEWLVAKRVALVGVEPPSVADVNNLREVTAVHQTLFRGGVVIVEGLCHLDQLRCERVEFIALPLKVIGGDGSPVRAIAVEP